MADPARVARILDALPPDDADWLAELLLAPWQRRERRLAERDAAVRAAAALFPGLRGRPLARVIERGLAGYVGGADWRSGRGVSADPVRAAWHRIALGNGGRGLSAEQIINLLNGTRSRNAV